jgi:thiamine biosynthesis lipoprotein
VGHVSTGAAPAFGATVTATVVHADRRQAALAIRDALTAAQGVDRLMSIHHAGSQVSRLNRVGFLDRPDRHLLAVLAKARQLSDQSRGAFDITVQPLWRVFRAAARSGALPAEGARVRARSLVNWERVSVTPERVSLEKEGMEVSLEALARGYAADLALAAVRARGIEHVLLDTGEFAAGRSLWPMGVPDPRDKESVAATLPLERRCMATSGDYASTFTPDCVHHHIFDPATGNSPQELASVTVLAPTAMEADGWSTAFMVLGERKAHALAARLEGVDIMTINKRGVIWKSPGFPRPAI